MKLSIVICTYNRSEILEECLNSITSQSVSYKDYNILVIDNNSSDNTFDLIQSFQSKFKNIEYFLEKKQGLSHARNRGFKEAKADWVLYLDDDAKPSPNYVDRALWIIDTFDFDCFGGMFYAWHVYEKPKWLPTGFGDKPLLRKDIGLIDKRTGLLTGNNFAIKKKLLEEIGGFDPNLGMSGEKIAFGEEDLVQFQLWEKGYKIGFDPDLSVEHAVLPHKLKFRWHLESAYQGGITREQLKNPRRSILISFYELIKSILGLFIKRFPIGLYKLVSRQNYYWQNLVLDSLQSVLFHYGGFIWNLKNCLGKNE